MSRLCRARRSLPFCAAFSAGARAAQPRGQITTGWRICAAKLTLCSGLFENHHESQGKRSGKPSIRGTRLTVTMCSQAGHAASVKLLFDQNVSPGLPRLPADLYPGSTHVREVGCATRVMPKSGDSRAAMVLRSSQTIQTSNSRACCLANRRSLSGCALVLPGRTSAPGSSHIRRGDRSVREECR